MNKSWSRKNFHCRFRRTKQLHRPFPYTRTQRRFYRKCAWMFEHHKFNKASSFRCYVLCFLLLLFLLYCYCCCCCYLAILFLFLFLLVVAVCVCFVLFV